MSARRVVTAVVTLLMGAALMGALSSAPPASADGAPADSAMTKSGTGAFNNLKVTVSQTKNLINQAVTVTWTGGAPTQPQGGFGTNYLEIMQCWGDEATGPDRTQCQFGGVNTGPLGTVVASRQVTYSVALVDPKETLKVPFGQVAFVPFWAVGKAKPEGSGAGNTNDFFDAQSTNEVPAARTHGDGTGVEYFEVQTVRQAAGLGCGDPVTADGGTKGRSCWLVVVPRGDTEVDGKTRGENNSLGRALESSPLSQTNWDKRIFFPLEFLPVGQACPIGSEERRILGNELMTDAVGSWQPVLCGSGKAYTYTQQGDDVVRNLLLGGNSPGLALMTNPIPPDQAPADSPLVYAPVGLSGLAIVFNVEHQPPDPQDPTAPPTPEEEQRGRRFTSMKLTPRLVAKLLTQSYFYSVVDPPDAIKNNPSGKPNPLGLLTDPEFLDLNPDYKGFTDPNAAAPDALVQLGSADVTSLLWSWVTANQDARDFLAGKPDPSGMVVNPNNQNLPLPTTTFPRNDQSCRDVTVSGYKGMFCTQDARPFTNDMHDAGRSAARGDTQGRTPNQVSGAFVTEKGPRQVPGRRGLLAVVDAATATRYGLPTAALLNTAGEYVAPTTPSLLAGEAAMKPSTVPGVLMSDPITPDKGAYPLTALTYAVAAPSTLDTTAAKDYAAFVRYGVGPGQQPGIEEGQLPPGLVPLPDALKAQAVAAAAIIEKGATKPPDPKPESPNSTVVVPGSTPGSNGNPRVPVGPRESTTSPSGGSGTPTPVGAPPGANNPGANVPSVVQQPVAVRRTPPLPAPAVGALLLTILICGALAATSSPVLQSPVIHRLRAVVRRLTRREVTPPEQ
ncbi:MAG: hypothetical protein ACRDTX_28510 [Pseudonocardiaceae bacterium]